MDFRSLLREDELGRCHVPSLCGSSALKIAAVSGRIVGPDPPRAGIDLEFHKTLFQIECLQFEGVGACVQGGMITGSWHSWLAFLLATGFPPGFTAQIC